MNDHIFNNPMVDMAKKALTPEQQAEYKKMGEYMYNNNVYSTVEQGSKIQEPDEAELACYATESLKAGLDPMDLTQKELRALIDLHGDSWYEKFDYKKEEVPVAQIQILRQTKKDIETIQEEQKKKNRRQRRAEEQSLKKLESLEKKKEKAEIRRKEEVEKEREKMKELRESMNTNMKQ